MKVAFFDLFSGAGLASLGAKMAGAVPVLAWDCWGSALRVHEANHPLTHHRELMIGGSELGNQISVLKAWFMIWREKGYHIHLHGSPPCQDLSNAKIGADLKKGIIPVLTYLEIVERTEPDSWSMENALKTIHHLPESVPAQIINSADFGVPQTRRRTIAGEGFTLRPTHEVHEWESIKSTHPHVVELIEGVNANIRQRPIEEPHRTVTSKTTSQSKIITNTGEVRSFTLEETAALQGIPGTYTFDAADKKADAWVMIGNALPPQVMKAIIEGLVA